MHSNPSDISRELLESAHIFRSPGESWNSPNENSTKKLLLWQKFYIAFIIVARACRRRLSYHQALLCKCLHFQYNTFIIHRKQIFRDHPMARCPENTQQTDRRTPHAEARFEQGCCYVSLLKSHFGMGAPTQIRHIYPKTLLKWSISDGLLPMHLQHTHRKY